MSPSSLVGRDVIRGPVADELVASAPVPRALSPAGVGAVAVEARDSITNPVLARQGGGPLTGGSLVLRGSEVADLPVVDFINPPTVSAPAAVDNPTSAGSIEDIPSPQSPAGGDDPFSADVNAAYDLGWAEGQAAARSEIDATVRAQEALAVAVAEMRSTFDNRWTATAEQIGDLAIEIAALILAREVSSATNPGRDAIMRSLTEAATSAPATFRLNPLDLAELGEIDDLVAGQSIELVADATVASGDAIVDVAGGRIDGTIAGALQRVAEVLES